MIIRIEAFAAESEMLELALEIRFKVFVDEQKVEKHLEYDGFDEDATHYLVFYNDKPVATCRWIETPQGIKLERFAVLKEYRGKGLALLLLKYVLEDISTTKHTIYLHAQDSAMGFYKNHGFQIAGDMFMEANIAHYKMIYNQFKN